MAVPEDRCSKQLIKTLVPLVHACAFTKYGRLTPSRTQRRRGFVQCASKNGRVEADLLVL